MMQNSSASVEYFFHTVVFPLSLYLPVSKKIVGQASTVRQLLMMPRSRRNTCQDIFSGGVGSGCDCNCVNYLINCVCREGGKITARNINTSSK